MEQKDLDLLKSEIKRLDELRELEVRRIDERQDMRANYEERLQQAEQKRLDAIRSVDVAAVTTAAEKANQQADILAKNVSSSAETLRQLVATTASQVAEQLKVISTQLADRLLIVEKAQYELKGKTGVTDPQFDSLIKKMDGLIESRATVAGTGNGRKEMWGYIIGGSGIIFGILSFLLN